MSEVFLDVALRSGYEKTPGGRLFAVVRGFFCGRRQDKLVS